MKNTLLLIAILYVTNSLSQNNNDTMFYHYITSTKIENIFLKRKVMDSTIILYFYTLDSQSLNDTIILNDSVLVPNVKGIFLCDEIREDNPIFNSNTDSGYYDLTKYYKFEPYCFTLDKRPLFIYVINDTFLNKMKIIRYDRFGNVIQEKFYIRDSIMEQLYNYKRKKYIWLMDKSNQKW